MDAKDTMAEVGLGEPTIILSSPPKWAEKLYKNDKEGFFRRYKEYVRQVKDKLTAASGKIKRIQIFNELNNPIFKHWIVRNAVK